MVTQASYFQYSREEEDLRQEDMKFKVVLDTRASWSIYECAYACEGQKMT